MGEEPTPHAKSFWQSMEPLIAEIRLMSMTDLLWLRQRLRDALGDSPDESVGVREPRRPYPSSSGATAVLDEEEER